MQAVKGAGLRTVLKHAAPKRGYGTTTKGQAAEHVPGIRGLVPSPPVNPYLLGAAAISCTLAGLSMWRYRHMRQSREEGKYEEMVDNNYEHWRDFANMRQSKYSKILSEGPCGESFQEAYLCALFPENEGQDCGSSFSGFASCVKENPILMRWVKPDGSVNWDSKLVLHKFLMQQRQYDHQVNSIGPAEEDLDQVLNEYRARYKLGPNATESEVNNFIADFKSTAEAFWTQVQGMFDGSVSDATSVDGLYKKLVGQFSIPADVWLEILKEYDVEEFDDNLTYYRRSYGYLLHTLKKTKQHVRIREGAETDKVSCGSEFDKLYTCMTERKSTSDCADIVDELYFCRQNHTSHVWPYMTYFEKKDASFTGEMERLQGLLRNSPFLN